GVVMTKMISNTNARSSSGVILMSLSVTSELRCENRRIAITYQMSPWERRRLAGSLCNEGAGAGETPALPVSAFQRLLALLFVFQIFRLHVRYQFLGEVVQFHSQYAQVVYQPVIAKH